MPPSVTVGINERKEIGVAILPGSDFGRPDTSQRARIATCSTRPDPLRQLPGNLLIEAQHERSFFIAAHG